MDCGIQGNVHAYRMKTYLSSSSLLSNKRIPSSYKRMDIDDEKTFNNTHNE